MAVINFWCIFQEFNQFLALGGLNLKTESVFVVAVFRHKRLIEFSRKEVDDTCKLACKRMENEKSTKQMYI